MTYSPAGANHRHEAVIVSATAALAAPRNPRRSLIIFSNPEAAAGLTITIGTKAELTDGAGILLQPGQSYTEKDRLGFPSYRGEWYAVSSGDTTLAVHERSDAGETSGI